jgi:hypothetical protein
LARVWVLLGRVGSEIIPPWGTGKQRLLRCQALGVACFGSYKMRLELWDWPEEEGVGMAAVRCRETLGHRMSNSSRMVPCWAHTDTECRETCHVNRTPPDLVDQYPPTDRTGSSPLRAVRSRTNGLKESGDYHVHLRMGAMHTYDNDPDSVATQPRV